MSKVKQSDKVRINFVGTLDDGTIIDSTYPHSEGDECHDDECGHDHGPYELMVGAGDFYVPVEEALIGMQVGDKKKVTISPEDGFGDYDSELVFSVERSALPEEIVPEPGMELEVTGEDDDVYMVTIIGVTDSEVKMDSNHPLAGEELTYEFELMQII